MAVGAGQRRRPTGWRQAPGAEGSAAFGERPFRLREASGHEARPAPRVQRLAEREGCPAVGLRRPAERPPPRTISHARVTSRDHRWRVGTLARRRWPRRWTDPPVGESRQAQGWACSRSASLDMSGGGAAAARRGMFGPPGFAESVPVSASGGDSRRRRGFVGGNVGGLGEASALRRPWDEPQRDRRHGLGGRRRVEEVRHRADGAAADNDEACFLFVR